MRSQKFNMYMRDFIRLREKENYIQLRNFDGRDDGSKRKKTMSDFIRSFSLASLIFRLFFSPNSLRLIFLSLFQCRSKELRSIKRV